MNYKILLSFLATCFGAAFLYYLTFFAFTIYINTTALDYVSLQREMTNQNNSIPSRVFARMKASATINKEDGFEIPVTTNFYYSDTIIQVLGKLNGHTESKTYRSFVTRKWLSPPISFSEWEKKHLIGFDTIFQKDTLITRGIVSQKKVIGNHNRPKNIESKYKENTLDVAPFQYVLKSTIKVKAKNSYQYVSLWLRENIKIIFSIFIFFQLLRSVLVLKSNFSFSDNLYNRIKIIGWAILLYALFQFLLDYNISCFYDSINIESTSTAHNYVDEFNMFILPDCDFSFEKFNAGLLLIIFSFLMKKSSEIEKNWSLTI